MRYIALLCLLLLTCAVLVSPTRAQAPAADDASAEVDAPTSEVAAPEPTPRPDAAEMELDLSSPRATLLETYFPAINRITREQGDVERAWEYVLATMQVPAEMDEANARARALWLLEVFDKLGMVTADHLPSEAELAETPIQRFVFFPQPALHSWVWDELQAFNRWPQGQIVLVRTEAGWQFSAETLWGIDALRESMAPLRPRYLSPQMHETDAAQQLVSLLGPTVQRTPWWAWLALTGVVFLGLLAGKLISTLLRRMGETLRRRGWGLRAVAFDDAANPVSLACLTFALTVGMRSLVVIEPDSPLDAFVGKALTFLYLLAMGWFLYNLVDVIDLALRRFITRGMGSLDEVIFGLIRKALRIVVVIMFTLVVAENVFGLNIAAWLAGFGIAGLAVSLAAQDSIRNIFGSLTVFFDKPFKVGDFVTFEGQTGTITEIGFRSTKQQLLSGAVITIPNMKFIDNNVENISRRETIRRVMDIGITYDTPSEKIEQAVQIVKDVLHSDAIADVLDMENTPPRVYFSAFNADNLNIQAIYWYTLDPDLGRDWWAYSAHAEQVNMALFQRFAEAGIEFAFPTQTLYLAGDKERELAVRVAEDGSRNDGDTPP